MATGKYKVSFIEIFCLIIIFIIFLIVVFKVIKINQQIRESILLEQVDMEV